MAFRSGGQAWPTSMPSPACSISTRQFYEQEADAGLCRDYIDKRISRSESVVFVAYDERDRSALGFTQLYPTFCSVAAARIFVLYDLFVHADARRRGVGRMLMDTAAEHARAAGAVRLQLETHHTN